MTILFSCEEKKDNQSTSKTKIAADTVRNIRRGYRSIPSAIVIEVTPANTSQSHNFSKFISIAKQMNYTQRNRIQRTDSIYFRCWTWLNDYDRLVEELVFKGITTHYVVFKEITPNSFKKGYIFEEAIFPSETKAIQAEKRIRDFIFKDSTTVAYDKVPTDIFRYKNNLYQLSVSAFMSIPDMKKASRRFRKILGPSIVEIMLWDKYGNDD